MFIDIIAGARPNFVKISAIITSIDDLNKQHKQKLSYRIIHTGQHYSERMSEIFFAQLKIPNPRINLNVGSGTHSQQTAKIMTGYERVLNKRKPDICLVVGDVNSTLACAITAKKLNILVAHIEAGLRSNDHNMPEEINRIVTDSISDYLFCTTQEACDQLIKEGKDKKSIFFVGNTMIDTLIKNQKKLFLADKLKQFARLKNYYVLTMHRPSNVDNVRILSKMIMAICDSTKKNVIFPVHPRTKKNLKELGLLSRNLIAIDPLSYLEFNYLLKHSTGIFTDSGGITEEATYYKVPCITFRENTERPETINQGTNVLIGNNLNKLRIYTSKIERGKWKKGTLPKKWDGKAGLRIIKILSRL